jgi:hypothetical protein
LYPVVVEITQYIQLPDGSYAAVVQSMSYGDIVIILLLVVIVFVELFNLWRSR